MDIPIDRELVTIPEDEENEENEENINWGDFNWEYSNLGDFNWEDSNNEEWISDNFIDIDW